MVRVWRGRGGQRALSSACAGAVVGPVAEEHLGRARYVVGAALGCCCGGGCWAGVVVAAVVPVVWAWGEAW
jgi:hypothetical protein